MTPERIQRLRSVLDRRQPDLTLITDFVHKQRNLSAIVRNCDAAGIGCMHAVLDPQDYRAYRGTAMGSHQWVQVRRHENLEQALTPLQSQGFQVVAAHVGPSAKDYRDIDYTRPTAILLGAEKVGVSSAGQAAADHLVTIPMMGMVESLNVSVAAGIILSEAQRQKSRAGHYACNRLSEDLRQQLFFQWGHPVVRRFCEERQLAYPPLGEDGEIVDASGWYASVRAGTAPRCEDFSVGWYTS